MTAVFPTPVAIPGIGYPVLRTLETQTILRRPANMRDVSSPFYVAPLREWQLIFNVLRKTATFAELQTVAGFFLSRSGSYQAFWYTDPIENTGTNVLIGVGTGAQQTFTFGRFTGPNFYEEVDQLNVVSAIRVNNILVAPANYTIVQPNQVTFTVAPGFGLSVNADFTYYFNVRFSEDLQSFDQFMRQLYDLKTCRFRSARL